MSLVVNLLHEGTEVPLEIFPHEDFATVLERASNLVGYDIDISSLTGNDDKVDFSDNVYEYFMTEEAPPPIQDTLDYDMENVEYLDDDDDAQVALKQEPDSALFIDSGDGIRIIELTEGLQNDGDVTVKIEPPYTKEDILDMLSDPTGNERNVQENVDDGFHSDDEKVDCSKIVDLRYRNRITCHLCSSRISAMKDSRRNYLFEEKNRYTFKRKASRGMPMECQVVCMRCLDKKFVREKSGSAQLEDDQYIFVRNGIMMVYWELPVKTDRKPKQKRKSKIIVKEDANDVTYEYAPRREEVVKPRRLLPNEELKTDFVVRRKISKEPVPLEDTKKMVKVIKRKLEMDGTISEIIDDVEEEDDSKRRKISMSDNNGLICRSCGLQFIDLTEVVEHGRCHQVNNRINALPCALCLRNFKSTSILKRHVFAEHKIDVKTIKVSQEDDENDTYFDENEGSFVKYEHVSKSAKKEKDEYTEEKEYVQEDDMTDRLHKYLSGELDADTFFQQECLANANDMQALNEDDEYDDDDVIVCIVESEEPEKEEEVEEKEVDLNTPQEIAVEVEAEQGIEGVESIQGVDIVETTENVNSEEIQIFENVENPLHLTENMEGEVEAFQEVDYFEDPEYEPEEDNENEDDDDNESLKSHGEERRPKKRWSGQGKYKCEVCKKGYTTQMRLDQHKCYPVIPTSDDKKEDTTCTLCKETFLSKVRLQFHRQTHKEGGWQHMGCDRCSRRDFASEHELFDHVYFSHSKPFFCPYDDCAKTFKLKKLLKTHMRDHGVKKYECDVCGQRFQVHQTLKEHMVLHMKVKPFQCHICQKYMSKASRLRMHLLVHTSEQRPAFVLVCKFCDGAFKDPQEAEAHCDNIHECEPREEDKDGVFNEIFDDLTTIGVDGIKPNWRKIENGQGEEHEIAAFNKQNLLLQLSDVARNSIAAVWIDKVYSCQYCEKVYYTKEALHQHRLMHSGISEPYQCHLCEARFLTYARCTAHKSTHGYFKEGGAPSLRDFPVIKHYLCDICDKSNLLWTTVSVHYRHHHKHNTTRQAPPQCKTCYTQYNHSWELGKHRRIRHRRDVHEGAKAPNKVVNFSYKCTDCDQQLPNRAALTSHRKAAHGADDFNKRAAKQGVLVCSECGKTYATKPALLTHIKWHTEHGIGAEAARRRKRAFGKGNHICYTCGLGFYSAANLRAHIDRIHEKSYKYTCEECGKGHFTHMEMETHKLTHTGERPFKCSLCPRAYVTKAILNKHFRNHTGERPYSCDICSATFKTAHSRNYHKMKHDNGKLPAPVIILEVKGRDNKELTAAIKTARNTIVIKDKEQKERVPKHIAEEKHYIKEEIDDFNQEVNEEEVLIRTSEVEEMDENIVPEHEETPDGVQIVYKRVVRSIHETGCENEYTIEYEEA